MSLRCYHCQVRVAQLVCPPTGKSYCSVACQVGEWIQKKRDAFILIGVQKKRVRGECDSWEKEITTPISQLICGQFRVGRDWETVLANVTCTTIGERVAKSLVRVASTRIFSDPTQSILEPVVNALDAYNPTNQTGKFGMGFFSLLYWVITKNARLTIRSTYAIDAADGKRLCSYEAVIYLQQKDVLMIRLNNRDDSQHTGTEIKMEMGIDEFLFKQFSKQLRQKLIFFKSTPIFLNDKYVNTPHSKNFQNELGVNILIDQNGFSVLDLATGISREILLSSLLVPTISTKTIQLASKEQVSSRTDAQLLKKRDKRDVYLFLQPKDRMPKNFLGVLVNSVGIVTFAFDDPFRDATDNTRAVIGLDFPTWTKIPVSRDDVILSSVRDEFSGLIYTAMNSTAKNWKTITIVQNMINEWSKRTASEENRSIIHSTLELLENKTSLLLVHYDYAREYSLLQSRNGNFGEFVTSLRWNPNKIEGGIRTKTMVDASIFMNRDVVFIIGPSEVPFTAGLPGLLFVSEEYAKQPNWPQQCQTSTYSTTLFLRGQTLKDDADGKTQNFIRQQEFPVEIIDLLLQIVDQEITVARNGWQVETKTEETSNALIILLKHHVIDIELLRFLCREWYPKLIQGCANYTYGGLNDAKYNPLTLDTIDERSYLISKFAKDKKLVFFDNSSKPLDETHLLAKARRFATDAIISALKRNLQHYSHFSYFSLHRVVWGAPFYTHSPLRSIFLIQQPEKNVRFGSLLRELLSICDTGPEFYWCQVVLLFLEIRVVHNMTKPWIEEWLEGDLKSHIPDISKVLLRLIRAQFGNVPTYDLTSNVTSGGYFVDYFDWSGNGTHNILVNAFIRFLEDFKNTAISSTIPVMKAKRGSISFTLNEFIAHSFQQEWPDDPVDFVKSLETRVATAPAIPLVTQMIEIVVNEGTTKDVVTAQLTETLQNSLDAIRQSAIFNQTVEVNIHTHERQMFLSVHDYVGIDVDGLIAMSIPFYSNKSISQALAGEMGTGFFNVYRSDAVLIKTSRNGHFFHIVDTPVRDPVTNRVLDVRREMFYERDPYSPNGTTITVMSSYQDAHELLLAQSGAKEFVSQVLSLIRFPDASNGQIQLNGRRVTKMLTIVKQNELFEMYRATEDIFNSYVLTKGVPFQSLVHLMQYLDSADTEMKGVEDYAKEFLSHGYVLNIRAGAYTPVQTRTKIGMAIEVENSLRMFLFQCTYEHILFLPTSDRYLYFQHYAEGKGRDDPIDIEQVKPEQWNWHTKFPFNLKRFVTLSTLYDNLPSFSALVYALYDTYKSGIGKNKRRPLDFGSLKRIKKFSMETIVEQIPIQNKPMIRVSGVHTDASFIVKEKLLEIAKEWFVGKRIKSREEQEEIERRRAAFLRSPENHPEFAQLTSWLHIWIETYVEIGKELGIFVNGRNLDKIEISPVGVSYFEPSTQNLHFRIELDDIQAHIQFKEKYENMNNIQLLQYIFALERNSGSNPIWKNFYGPTGTIPHELEHFRRNNKESDKNMDVHADAVVKLDEGGEKSRNFEECHRDTMKSIVKLNFHTRVQEKILKLKRA